MVVRRLEKYVSPNGRCPFDEWFESIRNKRLTMQIDNRLLRLRHGHLGECKIVGKGIKELRIHDGPGFRIYFGEVERMLVILPCAGEKKSQKHDILKAQSYWEEYMR